MVVRSAFGPEEWSHGRTYTRTYDDWFIRQTNGWTDGHEQTKCNYVNTIINKHPFPLSSSSFGHWMSRS